MDTALQFANLTIASVDSTSDTLPIAREDSTPDTLPIAREDSTSDTLPIAREDSTPDTLPIAREDSTPDTLPIASVGSTSDTLPIANVDSTSDTISLARLDKEHQGPWEAEYSYGGEADFGRHYILCDKNPGHQNFIPVDKFGIQDLPEDYRDSDVVDYIRAISDLTVRVSVKYVSDRRPATVPSSGKLYPGFSLRGRRRTTVGTGYVYSVDISQSTKAVSCQCSQCRRSSAPEIMFARVQVRTAAHVVFDDQEGAHTTCDLFFDRGNRADLCSGVVELAGMSQVRNDVNEDTTYMEHYTHDLDLARRLHQKLGHMHELRQTLRSKIPLACKFTHVPGDLDRQPLMFIVSHPHGCSKQISLGRWTSTQLFYNHIVSFQYNTATCPGSSGAGVCVLQVCRDLGLGVLLRHVHRVHCGAEKKQSGVNFCHQDGVFTRPVLVTLELLRLGTGQSEDMFCGVQEEDVKNHDTFCKMNPGQRNCFPLEKFCKSNLPPCYRNDAVMKCIKLMSDLTVRVSVNYVSEKRPETVPGTDIPYPWSSHRGSNQMRAGTGWIAYAVLRGDVCCCCKECTNSGSPKPILAYINITTAGHLVYDRLEAEHTTCQLFFDSMDTASAFKDVVTLTDIYDFYNDVAHDTSTIVYFIHDSNLVYNITNITRQYSDSFNSLAGNDVSFKKYIKSFAGQNTKQEMPMHIMVSHPHGCSKHVSIGYPGNPGGAATEESQPPLTSMYCPGSSGAPVVMLARHFIYPICQ
ncbi:hypothetical protein BsWGS_22064 [Bradybaena similaris]